MAVLAWMKGKMDILQTIIDVLLPVFQLVVNTVLPIMQQILGLLSH